MAKFLYLIRGLPGSGKSTLARKLAAYHDGRHLEADQYFYDSLGIYNFDASRLSNAHHWCQESVALSMAYGKTTIVSNTFTTQSELRPYFEMAKEYGYDVLVMTCKSAFTNVHNVPEAAMKKMRSRFDYRADEILLKEFFPDA